MSTKEYHSARSEIKSLINVSLKAEAIQLTGVKKVPETLDTLFDEKSEALLYKFEDIVNKKRFGPFWFGVWQSVVGSLIVFLVLGLLALILYGFKQNPFQMLTGSNEIQTTQAEKTSLTNR